MTSVTVPPPQTTMGRHAGPLALGAGLLFAGLDLGRLPIVAADDRATALHGPPAQSGERGLLLRVLRADAGVDRPARAPGPRKRAAFGAFAFSAAVVGTMTMAGDMWFDGFASPWLAEVAPQVFSTLRPTPILELGALLTLRPDGDGLGAVRARHAAGAGVPDAAALGLVVAGLVAFRSSFPPYGVPLGLVVAALGAGSCGRIGPRRTQRQRCGDHRAALGGRADVEPSAEGLHPVGEALQAGAPAEIGAADPVVGDRDLDVGAVASQRIVAAEARACFATLASASDATK